jgi:hypothetical protein
VKIVLALMLLSPVASLAQSPFDGTWIIDTSTNQLPQKLALYSLAKGRFRGTDWAESIKADGNDQKHGLSSFFVNSSRKQGRQYDGKLRNAEKGPVSPVANFSVNLR